jgi:hypothetical protein
MHFLNNAKHEEFSILPYRLAKVRRKIAVYLLGIYLEHWGDTPLDLTR